MSVDPLLLTAIFAVHLLVFSVLLWRRRKLRYVPLVLTFVLLLVSLWLLRAVADVSLWRWPLSGWLRGLAWFFGALSLVILILVRVRRTKD